MFDVLDKKMVFFGPTLANFCDFSQILSPKPLKKQIFQLHYAKFREIWIYLDNFEHVWFFLSGLNQ